MIVYIIYFYGGSVKSSAAIIDNALFKKATTNDMKIYKTLADEEFTEPKVQTIS